MLLQLSAFVLLLFRMSLNILQCHICIARFPLALASVQSSPRLFPQPHLPPCSTAYLCHGQHCRSPRLCPHLQDLIRCQTTVWMPLVLLMCLNRTPDRFGSFCTEGSKQADLGQGLIIWPDWSTDYLGGGGPLPLARHLCYPSVHQSGELMTAE